MASRGSNPRPRRAPRRGPSHEIVGAILDAAALLLERDGIDGLTTNTVARVAGVSVGSLYQYFPNKLAIVAELARRLETTALAMAAEEAIRLRDASARSATAHIVSLSCSPSFGTETLRRALLREVPRGWILRETRSTDTVIGELLTAFFTARAAQVRPVAMARAVFVVQHAVEGVVEAVLLRSPDALPSHAVQRELLHLGWAYLAPDGDDLAPAPSSGVFPLPLPAPPDVDVVSRLQLEPSHRHAVQRSTSSARGLATRGALLDATERVLTREGGDRVSVRAIVAEAKVGLGTFYRHFPRAESVLAAVAARIEQRACESLTARLDAGEEIASALSGAYEHAAPDALRSVLLREVPRRWIEETVLDAQRVAIARLAQTIERRTPRRQGDAALMAFAALHAVKSVIEAFLILEPVGVAITDLRAELHELAHRYLAPRS